MEYLAKIITICEKYKLTAEDGKVIWEIIAPIYIHVEFQKRLTAPYYHHNKITIGEHILGDTILTYKIAKKKKLSNEKLKRSLIIAMFHDLYVKPWMERNPKNHLIDYHAFTHPLEAVVNALKWFPEYFQNEEDALIIIDGIIHHMFPLPVRAYSPLKWEIHNQKIFDELQDKDKALIALALKNHIGKKLTWRRSLYIEGRIVAKADKKNTIYKDLKGKKLRASKKILQLDIKESKNKEGKKNA